MEWSHALRRFKFLACAFDGTRGFAPLVSWVPTTVGEGVDAVTISVPQLSGPSELVRYPRESEAKYGGRNALAVYENHLRSACERFVGFLGRKRPQREGIDAPLIKLMLDNADLRGNDLDGFWRQFSLEARARGSLLLVIDLPQVKPENLAAQVKQRAVPYIRLAKPEAIKEFELDDETGLFESITLCDRMKVDGKEVDIERDYDATTWRIRVGDKVIEDGVHGFGACPVLAFTESGAEFPVVGKFAQIADLSRRLFNARSEKDELLRSQTFSLLHLNVPPDQAAQFDTLKDKVAATIGTHSMLIYSGTEAPGFIAPDSGPAQTYTDDIEALQTSISRISFEDVNTPSKLGSNESGVARRQRFEALNSDLATFAMNLQALEMRMWELWHRGLGLSSNAVQVTYPTDYNLADNVAELDVLSLMQATGFPTLALNEKRKAIAASEFDNSPDETKVAIAAAIDEIEQEETPPADDTQQQP